LSPFHIGSHNTLGGIASYPSPSFSPSVEDVFSEEPLLTSFTSPPHSIEELGPLGEGPCIREEPNVWDILDEFFNTMYLIFPIVDHLELSSRLIVQTDWQTIPDLCTLVYSLRLLNTAGCYRQNGGDGGTLWQHIRAVELSRLMYDFADPPTLDAVVASLFLFTAYNVLGKHGRAFLYLDEAQSLADAFALSGNTEEEQRQFAIEEVLFNTQAATFALYGDKKGEIVAREHRRRSRIQRRQTTNQLRDFNSEVGLSPVAVQLRRRMTSIYLSKDVEDIQQVDVELNNIMRADMKEHQHARIQCADVIVTRQWQLSHLLVARQRDGKPKPQPSTLTSMGIAVMSWICILGQGELRIVGLGKLMELAIHIAGLPGAAGHQDVLRGLTGAVMREDYERAFEVPLKLLNDSMLTLQPALTTTRFTKSDEDLTLKKLSCVGSAFIIQEEEEGGDLGFNL
jgi:hypothetical protein